MTSAFQRAERRKQESRLKKSQKDRQKLLSYENTGLSLSPSPEEDAQDVGYEQHQADSSGEALAVAAPLDLLVLWHIGQGSPEHHKAGRQPRQQRPRALHVLLLQTHLCIHQGCPGGREVTPERQQNDRSRSK